MNDMGPAPCDPPTVPPLGRQGQYPPIPAWLLAAADTVSAVAAQSGHHVGGLMAAAFLAGCDAMRETRPATLQDHEPEEYQP